MLIPVAAKWERELFEDSDSAIQYSFVHTAK